MLAALGSRAHTENRPRHTDVVKRRASSAPAGLARRVCAGEDRLRHRAPTRRRSTAPRRSSGPRRQGVQGACPIGEQYEDAGHATRVDRVGPFEPLCQAQQALAPAHDRPAGQRHRGAHPGSRGSLCVLHAPAQRTGPAYVGLASGSVASLVAPGPRSDLARSPRRAADRGAPCAAARAGGF